ncbi:DUF885 domain-containing protein [Zeaxanthinibacter sp. PT1]|uniref:DUF885 domain-containing protein n=1 Tax=Zeaxanthinibacter TaxID=561554 RepID=UPI00234BF5C5|nr:DUF885 domain-containing protein [Zeaxanthinibacter sp. PT1]MDC6350457.1 DUF885 domain-containing protein [Zeaxanthinibacter sp. PT1]
MEKLNPLCRASICLFSILILSLTACKDNKENPGDQSFNIDKLANDYLQAYFDHYPEWATIDGQPGANHSRLSDNSMQGIARFQRVEDSIWELLHQLDTTGSDYPVYIKLKDELEASRVKRVCKQETWNINAQEAFFHSPFLKLGQRQPVGDEASRQATLDRWKKIPQYIRNDLANNKYGLEHGYALPAPVVKTSIEQLDYLINGPIENNNFYLPALRDSSLVFRQALRKIVEQEIMPELENYRQFLRQEYLPSARPEISLASIPDGADCYRALIKGILGSDISPDTLHQKGLEMVAEREKTLLQLGQQIYGVNTLQQLQEEYQTDQSLFFKSEEEVLAHGRHILQMAKDKLPDYFSYMPKANVVIQPMPKIEQLEGAPHYQEAPMDGSQPAIFYMKTMPPENISLGLVERNTLHETIPGHHIEATYARELNKHPFSRYYVRSGYSEAWAIYSEKLALEMGIYTSEKGKMGTLFFPELTALVFDSGIHAKGWSKEEAIEYILSVDPEFEREDAEYLVDRGASIPVNLMTYGFGWLQISKLRTMAEDCLQDKFDLKKFHSLYLEQGTMPWSYLEQQVRNWCEAEQNAEQTGVVLNRSKQ